MEEKKTDKTKKTTEMTNVEFNPLKNERIYVRFVPHENGFAGSNKAHALYGNMADGAQVSLCVPVLRSSGNYKNILTDLEKEFLEKALGLDYNALSVYNKNSNFWDNYHVTLTKEGITLNLADPEDYIRYKVLLANSDIVAPSVQERIDRPKATYKFEIVRDSEETSIENIKMDATMDSYMEFKKIQNDNDTMRVLVEIMDGRPYAQNTKNDFLRSRINVLIQKDPKKFLSAITDPLLHTKVIIRRAQELGKVVRRGDAYFLSSDSSPLCENGENPTLAIAARFLNTPAHQDIRFLLESEVEKNRV